MPFKDPKKYKLYQDRRNRKDQLGRGCPITKQPGTGHDYDQVKMQSLRDDIERLDEEIREREEATHPTTPHYIPLHPTTPQYTPLHPTTPSSV